jgi:hypothetical protein
VSEKDNMGQCECCGANLSPDESGLCTTCAIEAAEGAVEANRVTEVASVRAISEAEARPVRLRNAWIVLLCVCAALIVWRIPAVVDATTPQPPLRTGVYTTAGNCDECVANLWTMSVALADSKRAKPALVCPASGAVYVVQAQDAATVVSCPNPEKHDLSSLSISSTVRIPEAVAK